MVNVVTSVQQAGFKILVFLYHDSISILYKLSGLAGRFPAANAALASPTRKYTEPTAKKPLRICPLRRRVGSVRNDVNGPQRTNRNENEGKCFYKSHTRVPLFTPIRITKYHGQDILLYTKEAVTVCERDRPTTTLKHRNTKLNFEFAG